MRPQIKPGLRTVWRDDSALQIGLTPDTGVVIDGLTAGDSALLARLDGANRLTDLTAWAEACGLGAARALALVHLLDEAGVLTGPPTDRAHLHQLSAAQRIRLRPDAHAWAVTYPDAGDGFGVLAARGRHDVLVVGRSTVTATVRGSLRRSGLAVLTRSRLAAPPPACAVAVLVGEDAVGTAAGALLVRERIPHLVVVAGADRVVVGPFVIPGRTPCLRCVELYRTDRDPAWPRVAAQLRSAPPAARGERSLTQLAAALVALQVACWLDDRRTPSTVGATLTLALPDGLPVRRRWRAHPSCGCGWLAAPLDVDQ